MKDLDRRAILRGSSVLALGLLTSRVAKAAGITTPPQVEGPFYPLRDPADKDIDLTQIAGRPRTDVTNAVVVKGRVTDQNGKPLSGTVIDVWQACATGKYNHPQDPNPAAVDPNFQYFARMITDNDGYYQFTTIIPGAYPATSTWMRPPHIHFRIDAWGRQRLTTQMYFKGNALNDRDDILLKTKRDFGREAMETLIVNFGPERNPEGFPIGTFNIVLGRTPPAD